MATSSSRRSLLRGLGAAGLTAASTSLSGCVALLFGNGSGGNQPGGAPISFASLRNRITKQMADRTVNTRSQLIEAVGQPETTVWIPSDATIDMTGETRVEIANNVTIASDRNLGGNKGGLIRTTDQQNVGVFVTKHPKVHFRVTGVRLKGPRTDYFDPVARGRSTYDYDVTGFRAYGESVIVDHCEVFGWTGAGFVPGTNETPTQGWFHHNSMHHNQMNHLGYPMDLQNGQHLIEWNYFDYNRHSIAAFGHRQNAYEARFNVVGPHAIQHAFDMHYLGENIDALGRSQRGSRAGQYVNVHHNVFELTSNSAFSIQGIPQKYARFCQNWCAEPEAGATHGDPEGVVYFLPRADVRVRKNRYGLGQEALTRARQWLKRLAAQLGQRSNNVLATHPSPSALAIPLDIQTPPALPNSTNASTNTTQQPTQTSMNATPQSTATTQTARAPQTTTLRPTSGGDR